MKIIGFRVDEERLQKLESISSKTGMSLSEVLRSLVDAAGTTERTVYRPMLHNQSPATTAKAV